MKKLLITTCLLGCGLSVYTTPAQAYGFKKLNITDNDFNTKITTGEWQEAWVAQARVGDATSTTPNQTYEINLQDVTTACSGGSCTQTFETIPSSSQANFQWSSSKVYDFNLDFQSSLDPDSDSSDGIGTATLKFEGSTPPPAQSATISIGDIMDAGEIVNSLLIRVVAPSTGSSSVTVGEKLEISDDGFTDLTNFGDTVIATSGSTPRDVKYLQITGINGDFKLDGQTIFEWTGLTNLPRNSELAFQIKGMFIPEVDPGTEVPEPTSMSLLSVGILAAYGSRLRRYS
jgi:hypothetical protein